MKSPPYYFNLILLATSGKVAEYADSSSSTPVKKIYIKKMKIYIFLFIHKIDVHTTDR